ncbi:uncharacterized protein LOC116904249 [Rattus rattus]|uniref:uncharacterized protein LOC116904249 n=1 Tax=Rattus rattus TaxID=10117 RepID=UPI0013F396DB|nr:uncharacterized protein LOC116904249 [Rattus rattus]
MAPVTSDPTYILGRTQDSFIITADVGFCERQPVLGTGPGNGVGTHANTGEPSQSNSSPGTDPRVGRLRAGECRHALGARSESPFGLTPQSGGDSCRPGNSDPIWGASMGKINVQSDPVPRPHIGRQLPQLAGVSAETWEWTKEWGTGGTKKESKSTFRSSSQTLIKKNHPPKKTQRLIKTSRQEGHPGPRTNFITIMTLHIALNRYSCSPFKEGVRHSHFGHSS